MRPVLTLPGVAIFLPAAPLDADPALEPNDFVVQMGHGLRRLGIKDVRINPNLDDPCLPDDFIVQYVRAWQ